MGTTISTPTAPASKPAERYLADLEQLARYYRERGLVGVDLTEAEIAFAVALARYRFAPPAGKMMTERLHVMVFGGAGAGKSTIANILVGAEVAEANAQAGYTKHPVSYYRSDREDIDELWPERLGTLSRFDGHEPANVDRDHFGYRRLSDDIPDPGFFRRHVVWDCPDLTAKDAGHYQSRVIEVAALADACIYVASDERYNDELPTNFLQAMLDAGKYVVVALTKVAPYDVDELVKLFGEQVLSALKNRELILGVVPVPSPPPGKLRELWTDAFPYGSRLRETIEQSTGDFAQARAHGRKAAARYLQNQQSRLLDPLRRDLGEWQDWLELVRRNANDAVIRYEREYLSGVDYQELRDGLEQIMNGLQFGGPMKYVWEGLEFLRTPWRLAKGYLQWLSAKPVFNLADEDRTLDKVRRSMLESLQVASANRKNRHRFWRDLHQALTTDAIDRIEPAYHQARVRQRRQLEDRLRTSSREIHEQVQSKPWLLVGLRVARTLLDVLAIVLVLYMIGFSTWLLFAIPLAAGIVDELAQYLGQKYVQRFRENLWRQQRDHIRELIQRGYIDPLLDLPGTNGRRLYLLGSLVDQIPRDLTALLEDVGEGCRP